MLNITTGQGWSGRLRVDEDLQGDHSSGKPRKVREFLSGQGKVRENGKSQGKVRGSEIRCFFPALNTPKLVFRPGLLPGPRWGSLQRSLDSVVGWGGGHPIPFPQLLQPQLLKN